MLAANDEEEVLKKTSDELQSGSVAGKEKAEAGSPRGKIWFWIRSRSACQYAAATADENEAAATSTRAEV
jgi:hypothetical protein